MMIKKDYHRERLLCSEIELFTRIAQFQRLSAQHSFITTTDYKVNDEYVLYYQHKIIAKPFPLVWSNKHFKRLVKTLEIFEVHKLAHGDIVKRNVIFDGDHLNLIDFEPCLNQIKNSVNKLMYTPPYIATEDYLNGVLTSKTDKIGFFFLILRLRKILTPKILSNMFHLHMNQKQSILPISETNFVQLTYKEILKLGMEIKSIDWI